MKNNLLDNCYDFSSLDWRMLEKIRGRNRSPAIVVGLARFAYFFFKSLKITMTHGWWRVMQSSRGRVIFMIGTKNNESSLLPVANRLKMSSYNVIGYHTYRGKCSRLPDIFFYIIGICLIHRFVFTYIFQANSYQRWAMRVRFDQYIVGCGGEIFWWIYLKLCEPSALVVSNDHNVWTRTAIKAAKKVGVPTVFVPHAPTGNCPPPLIFDYAFFDGPAQSSMYKISTNTVILNVGAVRYESLIARNVGGGKEYSGIVIAFNKMDSIGFIERVMKKISSAGFGSVYVRPHPGDLTRFKQIEKLCFQYGLAYSNPSINFVDEVYLAKYVFAGVSGVHTDALMCGMTPLSTREWYSEDYYGYEKDGLIGLFDNLDMVTFAACESIEIDGARLRDLNSHLSAPEKVPSRVVAEFINELLLLRGHADA
ncbi:hypothetical protein [Ectopseudomonas toyotomiensis]|uniref:Uncharacterized protein n=1 Tax=Ectopseudomonas toyotomiensis TaxID=554344 RepID=A0AA42LLW7_9GAMM|nr:hypothetical protein [Pseudomonas toyotomiensis]MBG0843052.1 hypothetical protein [Pseudomonas toyotomiensis]MDH0703143.1 hypothetical protein [Pseudomonas toyotomiensis]